MSNYTIFIPSHRPAMAANVQKSLGHIPSKIFDGTDYPSFSKLINDCIVTCETENVIIISDKIEPTHENIDKMNDFIDQGFGITTLYRFAFFGFKKELIRQIGFFDQRFLGGGCEDRDMVRRLWEANIAYYESQEANYKWMKTTWKYGQANSPAKKHFKEKWTENLKQGILIRKLPEEIYDYDIGPNIKVNFKPWDNRWIFPVNKMSKVRRSNV